MSPVGSIKKDPVGPCQRGKGWLGGPAKWTRAWLGSRGEECSGPEGAHGQAATKRPGHGGGGRGLGQYKARGERGRAPAWLEDTGLPD